MVTAATIRSRVYEQLYGAFPLDRPFESRFEEAIDNSETAIDVTDGGNWTQGDILESATSGEQMLVTSVATNTLTVIRGYGDLPATVANSLTLIRKSPRFTQDQIDTTLTDTLNDFAGQGIHGFANGTFNLIAGVYHYELTETDIDKQYGALGIYYSETITKQPVYLPFTQAFNLSTAISGYTTGNAIKLLSKGDRATTDPVYYTYAQSLNYVTDMDTSVGKLDAAQEALLVLGAVAKLIGYTIIPATQDPGQRTDRSTPPGQTSRDGRWFQRQFYVGVKAEAARIAVLRQRSNGGSVRTKRVGRWRS